MGLRPDRYAEEARMDDRTRWCHFPFALAVAAFAIALAACAPSRAAEPVAGDAQYEQGMRALEAKKYPEAAEDFRQAIAINPKHVRARLTLGDMLVADGKPADADAQYVEVIK